MHSPERSAAEALAVGAAVRPARRTLNACAPRLHGWSTNCKRPTRLPHAAQAAAATRLLQPMDALLAQWSQVKATDLKALNRELLRHHFGALQLDTARIDHDVEDQIQVGAEE